MGEQVSEKPFRLKKQAQGDASLVLKTRCGLRKVGMEEERSTDDADDAEPLHERNPRSSTAAQDTGNGKRARNCAVQKAKNPSNVYSREP
jgi:hypothetical protein